MLRMWSEGVLILDLDGTGAELKRRAQQLFAAGYRPVSPEELLKLRYQINDLLVDLEGDSSGPDSVIVAATTGLRPVPPEAASCRAWIGTGKWMLREARALDEAWAGNLIAALRTCFGGDPRPMIELRDRTLDEYGGRLSMATPRDGPATRCSSHGGC